MHFKMNLEIYQTQKVMNTVLLNWDVKLTQETFTNDKPYIVDTEKRLSRIANNKAVGIDQVPGEWIKIKWFNKKEQEMNEL